MVTISVVAILATIAVPSFVNLMAKQKVESLAGEFSAALSFARGEALRRGTPVSVCRSSNGTACGGSWGNGWIVFVNTDGDSPATVDSGETVLRVGAALTSGYAVGVSSDFASDMTYSAIGMAAKAGVVAFCRDSDEALAAAVDVTRTRIRIARDTDGDSIPNKISGESSVNISSCESP